jgi:hypothetical protein
MPIASIVVLVAAFALFGGVVAWLAYDVPEIGNGCARS